MSTPDDMTSFLSASDLAAIRAGYDPARMLAGATASVGGHYAGAVPLMNFFAAELYAPERMDPQHRQRCILAILAGKAHPLTISVHVYWGLAEGLSLRDIYQVLLLTGAYDGIDAFTLSAMILKTRTLPLLRELIDAGGDAIGTANVLTQLVARMG